MPRSKRANGEGSKARKRKDGSWTCEITLDKSPVVVNGKTVLKTRRKSFYGRTQAICVQKRAAYLRENGTKQLETRKTESKETLTDYIERWLQETDHQRQPSTSFRYRNMIRCYITPYIGAIPLKDLSESILKQWQGKIRTDVSATMANEATKNLNPILKYALKNNDIALNPLENIDRFKVRKTESAYLKQPEVKIFFDTAKTIHTFWHNFFYVTFKAGLRPQETQALQWEDIEQYPKARDNGDVGQIHIRGAAQRVEKGALVMGPPKTPESARAIGFTNKTLDVLKAAKIETAYMRTAKQVTWQGTYDLVFPNEVGGFATIPSMHKWLDRIIDATKTESRPAGVTRITAHGFRHTFASSMIANGADVVKVSRILGHSKVSVTLDTYAHLFQEHGRESLSFLDDLIDG